LGNENNFSPIIYPAKKVTLCYYILHPVVGTLPCSNQLVIIIYIRGSKHQYENVKLTLLYLALIIAYDLTCTKEKSLECHTFYFWK